MFSNQFHSKKGRRPYMDSFAFPLRGAKHSRPCLLALEPPFSHRASLVSAQAEVGKRTAKLKRRKDTNLLSRYSALLSGITLCCCVRTDSPWQMWVQTLLHGHLALLLLPHRRSSQCHRKGELYVPYIQTFPRGLSRRGAAGTASNNGETRVTGMETWILVFYMWKRFQVRKIHCPPRIKRKGWQ